ncbi:F-box protein SKIP14 [Oryza brachyantha]|uniref:F-box domain-containing protein n=1 Tax=Oryza brachyantha TaxID=4533 RepID=J3LZ21_ORYBR|nr:F-box protein SKIP14 [Oryza brachyantha]
MALNYSSCSFNNSFLVNEDCAGMMRGCGCWSEEASPLSSCGVNSLWWDELEFELGLEEEEEFDPVDLLPTDPFGMNLETTFTAAIASCIDDLTVMSSAGRFGDDSSDAVFADLSYYLNQAFVLSPEMQFGGYRGVFEGPLCFGGLSAGENDSSGFVENPSITEDADDSFGFVENPSTSGNAALVCCDAVETGPLQEGGVPHEGMTFALGYLGLRDILSVEMVCKTLHLAVRNEPLLWKSIHIEEKLCERISDAGLLHLTRKCPDTLQCLSIANCVKITDQGLKAVLESNPRLTKLNILGCPRLTLDGIISNLKSFNTKAVVGIKHLRVGTLFSLQKEQYEELLSLLSTDKMQEVHSRGPRFLHANRFLSDCNDGYALDIEMCPICQNYKLVYDCPDEGCDDRKSGNCKGCTVCILRCYKCGRCVDKLAFKESFCLDWVCPTCLENKDSFPPMK